MSTKRVTPDKDLTELAQLDDLVERTAKAMREKLHFKNAQGYRGWKRDVTALLEGLYRADLRKDYLDICNYAAMLYDYQQRNSSTATIRGALARKEKP